MLRYSQNKIKISHHPDARLFAHLVFFLSMAGGAFNSMFPLILEDKLGGPAHVGYYYAFISVVCIFASLVSTELFTRFTKIQIFRTVLSIATAVVFLMNYAATIWNLAAFDLIRAMSVMCAYISLMLFVREYSPKNKLNQSEGSYYLFSNLGWIVGPLLGGIFAQYWGKEAVFNFVASALFAALVYFEVHGVRAKHPLISNPHHKETLKELLTNVRDFFSQKRLRKIFWTSFGFNFWCATRAIYMPIALAAYAFGEKDIGVFMALGMVPYILVERTIVKLAKVHGVRTYLVAGFWYLACFSALFYFLRGFPLYVSTLYVLANMGAAMIEPLKDIYFIQAVKDDDAERLWGIYNVAEYAAYLIAPLSASIYFIFSNSITGLWAFLAVCMAVFSLGSLSIEKKGKK